MKQAFSLLTLILSTSFLGCEALNEATQVEPDLAIVDASEIRTVSPLLIDGKDSVLIKKIDGGGPRLFEHKWVVSPGWHDVEIEAELNEDTGKDSRLVTKVLRVLSVYIQPGTSYLVQAKQSDNGVWIWIQNETTREVVSGEAPSL